MTINLVMCDYPSVRVSVRPSVRPHGTTRSHWKDFQETWYLSILRKPVQKIQVSLKFGKHNGYFTWRPRYIFDHISLNRLTPNDPYMGRTALLTSKRCILYIYSTNVGTEYLKHALYSPFFSLQNAVCFIMLTSLVPVLFTFYILGVLKLKK